MGSERLIHLPEVKQQVLIEPGASNLSPSDHEAGVCFGCAVSQGSQGILRPCCVQIVTPHQVFYLVYSPGPIRGTGSVTPL